jgi:hypothetical protein
MSPSHTRKDGIRYRYYISLAHLQARSGEAGSVDRVPASEVEAVVIDAVTKHLAVSSPAESRDLIAARVARVTVHPNRLLIELVASGAQHDAETSRGETIEVPWTKPPTKRRREILLPADCVDGDRHRPIRADARSRLVAALAQGRQWLAALNEGAKTEEIAACARCSVRKVNMTVSLAFLAPDLVKAAIEGRLPRGIGIARLTDLPASWSDQRKALGLNSQ